jgi:hypothetical protein
MYLMEECKVVIRRVIASGEHQPMDADPDDLNFYHATWQELKNEMCRQAGVTGAVTANMVTERLHTLAIRRVSRYERPWVI